MKGPSWDVRFVEVEVSRQLNRHHYCSSWSASGLMQHCSSMAWPTLAVLLMLVGGSLQHECLLSNPTPKEVEAVSHTSAPECNTASICAAATGC
jgi:hypothetical protein